MEVILFSTHCPRCLVLEEKLEDADIKFSIVEGDEAETAIKENGFLTAPVLKVDGEFMDFGKANKWINSLEN